MIKLTISFQLTSNSNKLRLYVQLLSLFYKGTKENHYLKLIDNHLKLADNFSLEEVENLFVDSGFSLSIQDPEDYEFIFTIDNLGPGNIKESLIFIMNRFGVKHYSIIESESNNKVSIMRNVAITRAKGNFLIFMDDDDLHCSISDTLLITKKFRGESYINCRPMCGIYSYDGITNGASCRGVWGLIFSLNVLKFFTLYFVPSLSITEDSNFISVMEKLKLKELMVTHVEDIPYFYVYFKPSVRYIKDVSDSDYRTFVLHNYAFDITERNTGKMVTIFLDYVNNAKFGEKLKRELHTDNARHKDEVILIKVDEKRELEFITTSKRKAKIDELYIRYDDKKYYYRDWNEMVRDDLFIKSW